MQGLETDIRKQLENDGVSAADMQLTRIAECRYDGQGFELRSRIPAGAVDRAAIAEVMAQFHREHQKDYGYCFDDATVEVVSLRVIGHSQSQKLAWSALPEAQDSDTGDAFLYERTTIFDDGQSLSTPRYDRNKLQAGQYIEGPAMLMQHDSTSLVPPGWVAKVSAHGNLIISRS